MGKHFGDVLALDRVELSVVRGEILAVVGPSGCGKSTLLRAVAGLTGIDAGRITLDGGCVAGPGAWVEPERRGVGIVFQDHALFPHLSVRNNVGFGLAPAAAGRRGGRAAGRADRLRRVDDALELVDLGGLADRFPHELSGGQQQRVALARALAPGPALVLLDEPFSDLDRNLRVRLREQTVAALRAAGASAVLVTHDQEEALAVGDRLAVMRAGQIEQVGVPADVFHAPTSRFVATFMGEADFLPATLDGSIAMTAVGPISVTTPGRGQVELLLRPDDVSCTDDATAGAVVTRAEFRGGVIAHHLRLPDGSTLRSLAPHTHPIPVGTAVRVQLTPGHPLVAFAAEGIR